MNKTNTYLVTVLILALFMSASVAFAASSSSSSTATSSNGGTSIAISSSQATGDGVAVSSSNADATKGGSTTAISSSTAKDGEVVVSNSNAVSPSPNSVVTRTVVNGATTSISSTSSNTHNNNNFFNYADEEIKRIEQVSKGIENINVIKPSYVYTEKVTVNGTTIYIFNPANFTNLTTSDALVSPNVTVDIPRLTTETANGTNLTYSISSEKPSKSPSLIQMILNLFHL